MERGESGDGPAGHHSGNELDSRTGGGHNRLGFSRDRPARNAPGACRRLPGSGRVKSVKILSITAGAAGMYCGSCLRDNSLAAELTQLGHQVTLLPVYTPTLTDEPNVSQRRVFFGGLSVYLQQLHPLFRKTPWLLDRVWDSRAVLKFFSGLGVKTDPRQLGALTLSMLQGEDGFQKKELLKLISWLKREPPPDIINLPNSLLIGLAQPLRTALQRPVCCTLQGEDLFLNGLPEPYRSKALESMRRQVRWVDGFAPVSRHCSSYMQELLGIDPDRMHLIPLGVRAGDYGNRRSARSETFRVGFLSRIAPEKGLHQLCRAYRHLKQRKDIGPTRLEVAGYLGPEHRAYMQRIRKQIRQWGLDGEFCYHGSLDRLAKIRFLENLDVLSVPATHDEHKGIPILEAMASGIPVVQPRRGSFTEMIEKTSGGLLTDPDRENSLEEGLHAIYRDPGLADRLARNGRQGVKDHYSLSRMAAVAVEAYRAIVQRSSSNPPAPMGETLAR